MKWEELPLADRALLMAAAVRNGYTDIRSIKAAYANFQNQRQQTGNRYDEGGSVNTDEDTYHDSFYEWKNAISEHMGLDIDNDRTYDYMSFYYDNPAKAWAMVNGDPDAHFTDRFKTAEHPTFSTESDLSGKYDPINNPLVATGGTWTENPNTFTLPTDWYKGPSIPERISYLENAENNGVTMFMPDGSLPTLYNNEPWGGVLPELTVTNQKAYGGNLFLTGGNKGKKKGITQQELQRRRDYYRQQLIIRGLRGAQLDAVLANMEVESTLDPGAHNDASGARGLMQWLGSRKPKSWSEKDQLDYIAATYNKFGGNEWLDKKAWKRFNETTDPAEAARLFRRYWERPERSSWNATDKLFKNSKSSYLPQEVNDLVAQVSNLQYDEPKAPIFTEEDQRLLDTPALAFYNPEYEDTQAPDYKPSALQESIKLDESLWRDPANNLALYNQFANMQQGSSQDDPLGWMTTMASLSPNTTPLQKEAASTMYQLFAPQDGDYSYHGLNFAAYGGKVNRFDGYGDSHLNAVRSSNPRRDSYYIADGAGTRREITYEQALELAKNNPNIVVNYYKDNIGGTGRLHWDENQNRFVDNNEYFGKELDNVDVVKFVNRPTRQLTDAIPISTPMLEYRPDITPYVDFTNTDQNMFNRRDVANADAAVREALSSDVVDNVYDYMMPSTWAGAVDKLFDHDKNGNLKYNFFTDFNKVFNPAYDNQGFVGLIGADEWANEHPEATALINTGVDLALPFGIKGTKAAAGFVGNRFNTYRLANEINKSVQQGIRPRWSNNMMYRQAGPSQTFGIVPENIRFTFNTENPFAQENSIARDFYKKMQQQEYLDFLRTGKLSDNPYSTLKYSDPLSHGYSQTGLDRDVIDHLVHDTLGRRKIAHQKLSDVDRAYYLMNTLEHDINNIDNAEDALKNIKVNVYDESIWKNAGVNEFDGMHFSSFGEEPTSIAVKRNASTTADDLYAIQRHEGDHEIDDLIELTPEQKKAVKNAYDQDFTGLPERLPEDDALHGYENMDAERTTTNSDARDVLLGHHKGKTDIALQNKIIDKSSDEKIFAAVEKANGYGRRYIQWLREHNKLTPKKAQEFREAMKIVAIGGVTVGTIDVTENNHALGGPLVSIANHLHSAPNKVKRFGLGGDEQSVLPEVEVRGVVPKVSFTGCVPAARHALAEYLGISDLGVGALYNMYGNAWDLSDSAYMTSMPYSQNSALAGDLVIMDRPALLSDESKGIPSNSQHVGLIIQTPDGLRVKHYTGGDHYNIDTLNSIKLNDTGILYTPTTLLRIPENSNTPLYTGLPGTTNGFIIQPFWGEGQKAAAKALNSLDLSEQALLSNNEDFDLKLATMGALGVESDFGGSKRATARHFFPNLTNAIKSIKRGEPQLKSEGYISMKPNIYLQNTVYSDLQDAYAKGDINRKELWEQTMKRTAENASNKYSLWRGSPVGGTSPSSAARTMAYLGIDPQTLSRSIEDDAKILYGALVNLRKHYPNLSAKELVEKYRGSKLPDKYDAIVNSIDKGVPYTDEWYNNLLQSINTGYDNVKNTVINAGSKYLDNVAKKLNDLYIPFTGANFRGILADLAHRKDTFTENDLSNRELTTLRDIARKEWFSGKKKLDYSSYTEEGDIGSGGTSVPMKMVHGVLKNIYDPAMSLLNLIGQGGEYVDENGHLHVIDEYDFNNQGTKPSFFRSFIENPSPYGFIRSLGTVYGSAPGVGRKLDIDVGPVYSGGGGSW